MPVIIPGREDYPELWEEGGEIYPDPGEGEIYPDPGEGEEIYPDPGEEIYPDLEEKMEVVEGEEALSTLELLGMVGWGLLLLVMAGGALWRRWGRDWWRRRGCIPYRMHIPFFWEQEVEESREEPMEVE